MRFQRRSSEFAWMSAGRTNEWILRAGLPSSWDSRWPFPEMETVNSNGTLEWRLAGARWACLLDLVVQSRTESNKMSWLADVMELRWANDVITWREVRLGNGIGRILMKLDTERQLNSENSKTKTQRTLDFFLNYEITTNFHWKVPICP